jgi:hypothetical protein
MAKKLGYGGIANTNGARSFGGKVAAGGATTIALARTVRRFLFARVFGRVN